MAPEFRPYRARLVRDASDVRLDGAWYEVDLDQRPGGDVDTSYRRLDELFRRLAGLDGARRGDLNRYWLDIESVPDRSERFRWVPTREGEDPRRWR